jgi:alkylhydroperoxidase family enzyme
VERGDYGVFQPPWGAAMMYADAITPSRGAPTEALFGELERHWSAAQIVEITSVITLFNYFNRFAVALRIPVTR